MLTIYGIDLSNSPDRWPLDAACLSLEAVGCGEEPLGPAFGMPRGPRLAGVEVLHVSLRGPLSGRRGGAPPSRPWAF
ncbi:hypothetical protein GCM10010339_50550 [Streptomyces alanosinicus]|uniref:Uncharacterized protein n=1 Tax=Streptomyces alanosinicus TaxID=68171 RepID=A0A919D4P9_9ACTN|nr:hypothetical protein GCM10010339_50550 [Streptomyces alanosinicus]